MTNAVAIIGLTFGGTDLQTSDFGMFLELVRGLNERPAPRGMDVIVPARSGRIVRNRVADVLSIELRGYVMGTDRSDFRTNALAVRSLFDPSAEPASLVASLEDASTASIDARTVNSMWEQITPEVAAVSIELESIAPDWDIA